MMTPLMTPFRAAIFLFIVGVLLYWPAFYHRFALHNDYQLLPVETESFFSHPETKAVLMLGRPLNAVFLNLHGKFLHDLDDVRASRIFNLVLFFAAILFSLFIMRSRLGVSKELALATGVGLLCLPSSQLNILWATQLIPITAALIIAIASSAVFYRWLANYRSWGALLLSEILFFAALAIYPATATFFLFFPLVGVLLSPSPEKRVKEAWLGLGFVGANMLAYFVFVKYGLIPYLEHLSPDYLRAVPTDDKKFVLATDLGRKYAHFRHLSGICFTTWDQILGQGTGRHLWERFAIMVAISLGLRAFYKYRRGALKSAWGRQLALQMLTVGAILVGMNAPILASQNWNDGGYRMLFPYSAVVIVLILGWGKYVFSWIYRSEIWRQRSAAGALVLLLLATWINAKINSNASIENAVKELQFLRQKISEIPITTIKRVTVINQGEGQILIPAALDYEFKQMALNYLPQFGIFQVILNEAKIPKTIDLVNGTGKDLSFLYVSRKDYDPNPSLPTNSDATIDLKEARQWAP